MKLRRERRRAVRRREEPAERLGHLVEKDAAGDARRCREGRAFERCRGAIDDEDAVGVGRADLTMPVTLARSVTGTLPPAIWNEAASRGRSSDPSAVMRA